MTGATSTTGGGGGAAARTLLLLQPTAFSSNTAPSKLRDIHLISLPVDGATTPLELTIVNMRPLLTHAMRAIHIPNVRIRKAMRFHCRMESGAINSRGCRKGFDISSAK